MTEQQSKDRSIAIIGAGISGLTAAHALKKSGYNNITIFEAGDYIGGRINSMEVDGEVFETGAVFSLDSLKRTNRLAKKYNQPLERINKKLLYFSQGQTFSPAKYLRRKYSLPKTLSASWKFYRLITNHKYFKEVCYTSADPELFMNFKDYVVEY